MGERHPGLMPRRPAEAVEVEWSSPVDDGRGMRERSPVKRDRDTGVQIDYDDPNAVKAEGWIGKEVKGWRIDSIISTPTRMNRLTRAKRQMFSGDYLFLTVCAKDGTRDVVSLAALDDPWSAGRQIAPCRCRRYD